MLHVRPAAVSGLFYPDASVELKNQIRAYLEEANALPVGRAPKALIAPHAGYVYSGPIAGHAYALLAAMRDRIKRVVLFGPAHRVAVRGLALPDADAFSTPLGDVELDAEAVAQALRLPQVRRSGAAHALEHSLEVQLPFLQTVLTDFRIVPFAVGSATPAQVSEVMDLLWGGDETLILVSSDLSHYHSYPEAKSIDSATAASILQLDAEVGYEQACGAMPINGLLLSAERRGLKPELLDIRNSGDTAGDRSRVVGYASFAFREDLHDA